MRRAIVYVVGLLVGLGALQAQARDLSGGKANTAETEAPAQTQPRGALYRVSHQGNIAWLFGTIHVGKPDFYPLEPRVMQAFDDSEKFMVEVDMRDTSALLAAMQKYAMYGEGDELAKHISADTLHRLQQALKSQGLPLEAMTRMKPTMAANMLSLMVYMTEGYQAPLGADMHLMTLASKQGKPVEGLEDADYQFSLFDGLTARQQEQYLRETLDELKSGKARKQVRELLDAWRSADAKKLDALMTEMMAEKTVAADFTRRILIEKRNREMSEKIAALLKSERQTFVGVGLLHLIGKGGLPTLLRERGYTVEKIY